MAARSAAPAPDAGPASSSGLPAGVATTMASFRSALSALEAQLAPVLAAPTRELSAALEPLERAQLHATLAFAANALFVMYLKAQGVDPEAHPVRKEAERVRLYLAKVRKAVDAADAGGGANGGAAGGAGGAGGGGRVMALDVAAVNRFIDAAVPDLTAEQRRKLKAAGQGGGGGGAAAVGRERPAEGGAAGGGGAPAAKRAKSGGGGGAVPASAAAAAFLDSLGAEAAGADAGGGKGAEGRKGKGKK